MKQSPTNLTTQLILNYLFKKGIYAWRNSVGAFSSGGKHYQMGKVGSSDILAVLPPNGRFMGIEIKTGKDSLRPEQIGFAKNLATMGAVSIVVKDFSDFENQFPYIRVMNLSLEPASSLVSSEKERLAFRMEIAALVKPGA